MITAAAPIFFKLLSKFPLSLGQIQLLVLQTDNFLVMIIIMTVMLIIVTVLIRMKIFLSYISENVAKPCFAVCWVGPSTTTSQKERGFSWG